MKVQLEPILQNLFHRSSLEEVRVSELQEFVDEHPYFSTGHFLLAQKLKQQDDEKFELQSQRAALYFHDPLWLNWQLKQLSNGVEVEMPVIEQRSIPVQTAVVEEVPAAYEPEQVEIEEEPEQTEELEPEEQLAVETIGPVEEAIPAETEPLAETEIPAEEAEIAEAEEEPEYATEVAENNDPAEQTQRIRDEHPVAPPPPVVQVEQKDPLAFDPYYTIDYFASQGIKVPIEVQPGDKLGKQLKSFTEWLKTMKRLPQPLPEEQSDETEQHSIRQFAAGSLEEKEVVTETMAEVLVKQGRNHEAIAIYEKLSLLDPSKSAYFAAKIENLKVN